MMPRNLDSRVELVAPVEDAGLRAEMIDMLERCLADNTNSWELGEDGTWRRIDAGGEPPRSVQAELRERHLARAAEHLAAASAERPIPSSA
jgi:polyphosphate kinase